MKDPDNKVADLYDARHTPEIYVVDPQGNTYYSQNATLPIQ